MQEMERVLSPLRNGSFPPSLFPLVLSVFPLLFPASYLPRLLHLFFRNHSIVIQVKTIKCFRLARPFISRNLPVVIFI